MDNGYLTALPGCGISTSGGHIISGGAIVTTPAPVGLDADITLGSGGKLSVGTTFPESLTTAYQTFISTKQDAMYSGGVCIYAGNSQTFLSGYAAITQSSLMTLNEVSGAVESAEGGKYRVNLNINPTIGMWAETDAINENVVSLLRTRKPCITCGDWKDIYAMEMMIYHAVDNIAWRIMRTPGSWPAGVWKQYQGALYRWNAKAYSAQYVYGLQVTEDTFIINVGWINVTCTPHTAFAIYTTITLVPPESGESYAQYRLIYGGTPTASVDSTVTFIANPTTSQIYFPAGDGTALAEAFTAAGTTVPEELEGCQVISSIQDFNNAGNDNNWLVGVACADLPGGGYGATGFQLGYAQKIDTPIEATTTPKWTYNISGYWYNNLSSGAAVFTQSGAAVINGLQPYTS